MLPEFCEEAYPYACEEIRQLFPTIWEMQKERKNPDYFDPFYEVQNEPHKLNAMFSILKRHFYAVKQVCFGRYSFYLLTDACR